MSPEELAAIKARAFAASAGPWSIETGELRDEVVSDGGYHVADLLIDEDGEEPTADAVFIAHAREDIPALLAEIERRFPPASITDLSELIEAQSAIDPEFAVAAEAARRRIDGEELARAQAEVERLRAQTEALAATQQERDEALKRLDAVGRLRMWRNEDGQKFIFAGDLCRAIRPDLADNIVPDGNAPTGELFVTTYAEHLGVSPGDDGHLHGTVLQEDTGKRLPVWANCPDCAFAAGLEHARAELAKENPGGAR